MRCARVVLLAAREDLHDPLDLGLAADDRVELALRGLLREVAAELVEQLRALGLLALRAAAATLPPAGAGEHADDLVADLLRVGVEVEQDACGDAFVLADEAEQDVLGADVVVAERQRLAQRELQDLLRARRERNLAGRDLVALADDPRDLRPHLLDRDVEALEHPRREPFLLAQQAEQDVLGADVVVLQRARFVLRENDDLTGSFSESLEQFLLPLPGSNSGGQCTPGVPRTRVAVTGGGRSPLSRCAPTHAHVALCLRLLDSRPVRRESGVPAGGCELFRCKRAARPPVGGGRRSLG